jgi:hypothetical protein
MPVVEFKASEGKGWSPLPEGTYTLQISSCDPTKVSSNQNPQMMVEAVVVGGDHDGKKCTLWYPLMPKAAWRTRNLLEATGTDFEESESSEVGEDGKPLLSYSFDSDDLIGASFVCDVDQREYKGKVNNDFQNERPVEGSQAAAAAAAPKAAQAAAAPAAAPAAARTPAAAAAATSRRPRV